MPSAPISFCIPPSRVGAAAVLPLLVVFCAAFAIFIGWPAWPVLDAGDRIVYSAIVVGALAIVSSFLRHCGARFPVNIVAIAVCVVPTMWTMLRPTDWSAAGLAMWAAIVTVPLALLATATQRLAARDGSPLVSLILLGMSAAAGGLLLMTGSIKLGYAGFGLAAGMLIVAIAGFFSSGFRLSAAATTFVFAVLAGLLVSGRLWSELPIIDGVAVFAAPLIAWIARLEFIARWPTWRRIVVVLLIAAVPAIAVSVVAGLKAYHDSQDHAAKPYGDGEY